MSLVSDSKVVPSQTNLRVLPPLPATRGETDDGHSYLDNFRSSRIAQPNLGISSLIAEPSEINARRREG